MPPHLASLTLTPADDPHEAIEVLEQDAALVGDDRQGGPVLEQAKRVQPTGRERLLDELDAQPHEVVEESNASSSVQPVLASTRMGPSYTARTASSVARSAGPAHLDLEGRERRGAARTLRDDIGGVDAEREIGRWQVARQPDQLVDRDAGHFAGQVVQRDVDGALGGAVAADDPVHRPAGGDQPVA